MRQHALLDDGAVEVAAGDVHAAAGIDLPFRRITQSHHGDIERAAAEVEDDHVLRLGDGLLVIQCGGDRLEFKVHFLEARFVRGMPKGFLCLVILFRRLQKISQGDPSVTASIGSPRTSSARCFNRLKYVFARSPTV